MRREVKPLLKKLEEEEGFKITHLAFDILFSFVFTGMEGFYANADYTQYSVVELEGFWKWSVYFKTRFPGYDFDPEVQMIFPSVLPRLSYSWVMNLLKSTKWSDEDIALFEETLAQHGSLFLDGKESVNNVALASYVRSGNSLSRKYIEDIAGILTGSTSDNRISRSFALSVCGFKGENHWGDNVWVYKTHIPTILSTASLQKVSKAIVCVRNPFDVVCSAIQLRLTFTHNLTSKNNIALEFPEFWDGYIKNTAWLYNITLEYWTQVAERKVMPVHFYRFEDLVSDPLKVLKGIFEFMLGVKDLEGTFAWRRI